MGHVDLDTCRENIACLVFIAQVVVSEVQLLIFPTVRLGGALGSHHDDPQDCGLGSAILGSHQRRDIRGSPDGKASEIGGSEFTV